MFVGNAYSAVQPDNPLAGLNASFAVAIFVGWTFSLGFSLGQSIAGR
jgi:hypothetical protein